MAVPSTPTWFGYRMYGAMRVRSPIAAKSVRARVEIARARSLALEVVADGAVAGSSCSAVHAAVQSSVHALRGNGKSARLRLTVGVEEKTTHIIGW